MRKIHLLCMGLIIMVVVAACISNGNSNLGSSNQNHDVSLLYGTWISNSPPYVECVINETTMEFSIFGSSMRIKANIMNYTGTSESNVVTRTDNTYRSGYAFNIRISENSSSQFRLQNDERVFLNTNDTGTVSFFISNDGRSWKYGNTTYTRR